MERRNTGWIIGLGCLGLFLLAIPLILVGLLFAGFVTYNRTTQTQPPQVIERQVERAPQPSEAQTESLNDLFEAVDPGVVSIIARTGQQIGEASTGSGFIIDEEGHIATNNHVVAGADTFTVIFFNGIEAQGQVVGTDPDSDLAIIKVEDIIPEAHPLKLGDSESVRVGDRVVAIGNPFALENTMTYGIVSAVGRAIPSGVSEYRIPQAIQTDAAINPGNSGGPLINLAGEVIGVNAQIQTSGVGPGGIPGNIGIGFAIPSNILNRVAPELIAHGSYQWPYLGVSGYPVSKALMEANNLKTQRGAYIDSVTANTPAAKAGLQGSTGTQPVDGIPVPSGGDVVTAVDDQPVQNFTDLLTYVTLSSPGDQITLTVIRDGKTMQVPITLEARPGS